MKIWNIFDNCYPKIKEKSSKLWWGFYYSINQNHINKNLGLLFFYWIEEFTSYQDLISNIQNIKVNYLELTDDERKTTYWYCWYSQWAYANSYADITVISNDTAKWWADEYYYTKDIIKLLEAWSDMHKKWNNTEERQKLIDEYKKSEK